MLSDRLVALVERVICRYVSLDPIAAKQLGTLANRVIKLQLPEWGELYIIPYAGGIHLKRHCTETPQATITSSPLLLLRIAVTRNQHLAQQLQVDGDIQLVQTLNRILQQLDIDWEEHLSHITGDVIAHQMGNAARGFQKWRQQFSRQLQSNLTHYLQEESRHLPPREEIEDFFTDIATLQQDVERLEAQLQQQLADDMECSR
jgi:ubiquinone biosynthesis protein UbiJ